MPRVIGEEQSVAGSHREEDLLGRARLVERDPVTMPDALTTVYKQMGITADKELMSPGARPIEIIKGGTFVDGLVG